MLLLLFCSQREAADLRRGLQPVEPHQLHRLLRGHHQRVERGPPTEDICSLRLHPGDQDLQGQGLCLRQASFFIVLLSSLQGFLLIKVAVSRDF